MAEKTYPQWLASFIINEVGPAIRRHGLDMEYFRIVTEYDAEWTMLYHGCHRRQIMRNDARNWIDAKVRQYKAQSEGLLDEAGKWLKTQAEVDEFKRLIDAL
jgi:hypothetical protein